jgi:hypothetical protein
MGLEVAASEDKYSVLNIGQDSKATDWRVWGRHCFVLLCFALLSLFFIMLGIEPMLDELSTIELNFIPFYKARRKVSCERHTHCQMLKSPQKQCQTWTLISGTFQSGWKGKITHEQFENKTRD